MADNKHVVTYLGSGMWKDSEGKLWSKAENGDVKHTRSYNAESKEAFLGSRPDIEFMVNYGQMMINSTDEVAEDSKEPVKEDSKEPVKEDPKEDGVKPGIQINVNKN